jgi:hypothetical protein
MKLRNWTFVSCAVVSLAISGCATNAPDSSTSTQAPLREVPSLKVITDCGACQVRASVPGLIVEGYGNAAAKSGAKLALGQEATVSIKEYAARDDGARFMIGAFAGKDEIKAAVSFREKQFMVEDYYRNAWLGIEDLAKKIGEMIFERVTQ